VPKASVLKPWLDRPRKENELPEKVIIGDAELWLGDCREVLPMIGRVDAVVTDPPYGIGFHYESYDDTRENLVALIESVFPRLAALSENIFCLCGPTQIGLYPQPEWVGCITWDTTGTSGKYGYNQWTPLLCYGKDLEGFGNVNGVTKSDTLRIHGGGGVGFQRSKCEQAHPCPKPLKLMELVINRFTKRGGTVMDPFMGSGTTGVACINQGRRFFGIEKEPKYFEISCKRIAHAVEHSKQRLFEPEPEPQPETPRLGLDEEV